MFGPSGLSACHGDGEVEEERNVFWSLLGSVTRLCELMKKKNKLAGEKASTDYHVVAVGILILARVQAFGEAKRRQKGR